MDKIDVLQTIKREMLVSVIRMDPQTALEVIEGITEGGIKIIEITMTMPGAIKLIEEAREIYKNSDVVIGAGTVLDETSARLAMLSGAEFIVSANFKPNVAKICNLYRTVYIPGVQTANEISACLEHGMDIMKLFPCSQLEPSIIKDLKGPFPQANFLVTGKMDLNRIDAWLEGGAFAIGVGGVLTNNGSEQAGKNKTLSISRQFVQKVSNYRQKGVAK
jgi:2-keto-3-deoxy-6-phosphogluconate aldolase